jgi:hypothetical protein
MYNVRIYTVLHVRYMLMLRSTCLHKPTKTYWTFASAFISNPVMVLGVLFVINIKICMYFIRRNFTEKLTLIHN